MALFMLSGMSSAFASANSSEVQLPASVSQDWRATVQKNIQELEYHITYNKNNDSLDPESSYQAPNRAQNLRTLFNPGEIKISGRTDNSWTVVMRLVELVRGEDSYPVPECEYPAIDGPRIEYSRGIVNEWYENKPEGLEQGFTIKEKFAGDGPLELILTLNEEIIPVLSEDGKSIDLMTSSNKRILRYGNLYVYDDEGKVV